jgi:hypothetical protein
VTSVGLGVVVKYCRHCELSEYLGRVKFLGSKPSRVFSKSVAVGKSWGLLNTSRVRKICKRTMVTRVCNRQLI